MFRRFPGTQQGPRKDYLPWLLLLPLLQRVAKLLPPIKHWPLRQFIGSRGNRRAKPPSTLINISQPVSFIRLTSIRGVSMSFSEYPDGTI